MEPVCMLLGHKPHMIPSESGMGKVASYWQTARLSRPCASKPSMPCRTKCVSASIGGGPKEVLGIFPTVRI